MKNSYGPLEQMCPNGRFYLTAFQEIETNKKGDIPQITLIGNK
jgi:hypothetical protein